MTIKLDLLRKLREKGVDHVIEHILSFLDARSLVDSTLVCQDWRKLIANERIWRGLTRRRAAADPVFSHAVRSLLTSQKDAAAAGRIVVGVDRGHRALYIDAENDSRKIGNLWLRNERVETPVENPHLSSVLCVHYLPRHRVLATGHLDGTVQCYDRSTLKKKFSFPPIASDDGIQYPIFHLADDGQRLIATAGPGVLRFFDVVAGVPSVEVRLEATRSSPVIVLRIRDRLLAVLNFTDEIGVFRLWTQDPDGAVHRCGGGGVDPKPLFFQTIKRLVDVEMDAERLYLLNRSPTAESILVYSSKTFHFLRTISREYDGGDGGHGRLLSLGNRFLIRAGFHGLSVYDNEDKDKPASVVRCPLGQGFKLKLLFDEWIVVVNNLKVVSVFDAKTLKRLATNNTQFIIDGEHAMLASLDLDDHANDFENVFLGEDGIFFTRKDYLPGLLRWEGR